MLKGRDYAECEHWEVGVTGAILGAINHDMFGSTSWFFLSVSVYL